MNVHDIIVEKQVDEGPLNMLGRAMGSKKAQLSNEIDTEVKNLWKEYSAVISQDPNAPGKMTVANISNFLKAKGFISSPQEVGAFIKANPSLSKKIGNAMSKVAGGAAKAAGALGGVAGSVAGAANKAAGAVKNQMNKKSGLTPAESLEMELENQLIYEATAPQEIDKKTALMIMKKFVQKGFQAQVGNKLSKSSFGDDPQKAAPASSPDKEAMVQQAIKDLEAMGYTVTKNGKKGGFMKGFKAGSGMTPKADTADF